MIFNAEMVRAILDGRKTQTRRVMKPQPILDDFVCPYDGPRGGHIWPSKNHQYALHVERMLQNGEGGWEGLASDASHFGEVGDRIWVRETFGDCGERLVYRADSDDGAHCKVKRWTPSIHMPRWASRLTLEIIGVRVERLASISDDDAGKEGYPANPAPYGGDMDKWLWFRGLWDSIYPDQSFKHNPWVWVIEFKVVPNVQDNSA